MSRRGLIGRAAGVAASLPLAGVAQAATMPDPRATVAFHGLHQGGILTPAQRQTSFAAFDLTTTKRADVVALLQRWTEAGSRMSLGQPTAAVSVGEDQTASDTGEMIGLSPSRLTVTFGFGATLFSKDGVDRYGIAARRPEALVDMPNFPGDQLVDAHGGGDLSVQACADDPQVAMHAIREMARLAYGAADLRWVQNGFNANFGKGETPRNLMGFKDGTNNPSASDKAAMDQVVWVGAEGPAWMRGGSYVVYRRARIALEHWDRMKTAFQEQTMGRQKISGAPIGGRHEHDKPDLAAMDSDGNPLIPENSHIRLAAAETNDGARIYRRAFSYDDGANVTAERWPPWKQGMEFDAGLMFICYQRDPRTGFIKLFEKMSRFDMMNQFVTNTAGALFACPGGVMPGRYIGQGLFDA
jgi:deferrochelatase/peroxidase EfeB